MLDDFRPSLIGTTHGRSADRRFGIKQADRLSHLYVIGKTGTGKSTLLQSLALQDLKAGRGLIFVDPHGDVVSALAESKAAQSRSDLIYWDVPDPTSPYGYNPLRRVRDDRIPLAVSGVLEAFKMHWPDAWGVRMEHMLRNALYALIETPESTLADILRLLTDKEYRRTIANALSNSVVQRFWLYEYQQYSGRYRADAIAPIQNKVGAFLADPRLLRLLTSPEQDLHLRNIMDEGGVLLVNLGKGTLGEDSANLLGSLLVTTIGLAAISRADTPEASRKPCFVYLDEFQSVTTRSVATMIAELRKYGVGFTLANQHFGQLDTEVRQAVLGNAGTLISFRVGEEDAALLSRVFAPKISATDLTSLPNYELYIRLMIDGTPSRPFSATTLPPDHGLFA
ncbi:MAG: type IV secretion system DNA-binding domain-containing protein [Rhodovibrionaceae bacterium]